MPKTEAGKHVLTNFEKEYGSKGKGYFFGKINKSKKFAKKMGESSVYNRGHK